MQPAGDNINTDFKYELDKNTIVESLVTTMLDKVRIIEKIKHLKKLNPKIKVESVYDADKVEGYETDVAGYCTNYIMHVFSWSYHKKPALKGAQVLCDILGGSWDKAYYLKLLDRVENNDWENSENGQPNIELIAVVAGILEAIPILTDLRDKIEADSGIPEQYTKDGTSFIKANIRETKEFSDQIFLHLVDGFREFKFRSEDEMSWFISNESKEFSALLSTVPEDYDWSYIAKRIGISIDQVRAVHQVRHDRLFNNYNTAFKSAQKSDRVIFSTLSAVQDYLLFLSTKINEFSTSTIEEGTFDPYTGNLALNKEYHKNIEQAYDLLHGEFIGCDLETFKGILVPGKFQGRVRIMDHSNLAEISYLLKNLTRPLRMQNWESTANCFIYKGKEVNSESLKNPGNKPRDERKEKLDRIVATFKGKSLPES